MAPKGTLFSKGKPISQAFKDKSKPAEVRTSNISAAKGKTTRNRPVWPNDENLADSKPVNVIFMGNHRESHSEMRRSKPFVCALLSMGGNKAAVYFILRECSNKQNVKCAFATSIFRDFSRNFDELPAVILRIDEQSNFFKSKSRGFNANVVMCGVARVKREFTET